MSEEKPQLGFREAMLLRYPSQAYVTMFEVANATGANHSRWADAITFSLWPSRGHDIEGFEFKCSRSDWKKELDNPQKANVIWEFCNRWWLVVTDAKIVKDGELPPGWGLLVIGSDCMKQKVAADRKDAPTLPKQFIGAMLRSAAKQAVRDDQAALLRAKQKGREEEAQQHLRIKDRLDKEIADLHKQIRDFELGSGISIASYRWKGGSHAKDIGRAITRIADGEFENEVARITRAATDALNACEEYRKARAALATTEAVA